MSDLIWTPELVRLDAFDLWERNPKTMTEQRAKRLLRSWNEMGQYQTLAIGPDGQTYDGHQRINVLRATGFPGDHEVWAMRSNRTLTEKERERLIVESSFGTVGTPDWDKFAAWDYDDLNDWGLDDEALAEWNDNAANLALMRDAAEDEPPEDENGDPIDIPGQWVILVECRNESEQAELLERFYQEGLECRALIS